ncbi:MAG: outer membrane lipoprotein-sorting protein [Bacteroidales bacterium]
MKKHIANKKADLLVRYRKAILALSLGLALLFVLPLLRIQVESNLKKYFPASMSSMIQTDSIEAVFGNQDLILVLFETDDILAAGSLERIRSVEEELALIPGIRKTRSLFGSNRIHGESGVMYVEPSVTAIPETPVERESLRAILRDNDLVRGIFVSDDFTAGSILLNLEMNADEDQIFGAIDDVLTRHPGPETVHLGGLPYLRQTMDHDIRRDGLILIPLALVLMMIFLYLVFKEGRGVWLPFLVVVLSALISIALLPLLGWKFYLITLLVPVMLIAVANDYGIHMVAKYQEMSAGPGGESMAEIAVAVTRTLWKPVLLTGLTTVAGISSLYAHTLIPARQMAIVASAGILLAIFFSLVLLPALLSMLKKNPPVLTREKGRHRGNALLQRFSRFVVGQRKTIPRVALGVTLVMGVGVIFLQVDSNEENFFPRHHPLKQASRLINEKFGGSENISVLFEGDMLDPAVLNRMESYRREMEKMPSVDQTMSFSAVVREISKALNDPGDPWYDTIPPTREAVAQYMELYQMSGEPGELDELVDFTYGHAHLMIRINNTSNETVHRIIQRLVSLTEDDPRVAAIGGYGYVRAQLADEVLRGTFISLGIALVLILALMALIFKSVMAGLLGIIPLGMSLALLFGIMGYTGVRLDVATALLSGIITGVGIDYSIHFLWRYRDERQSGKMPREAVLTTLNTTGRGILFNALSVVVGFSVLIASSFTPIRMFGVFIVVSILTCLIGAMMILPSLLLTFRFRFLEPSSLPEASTESREKGWKRIAVFLVVFSAFSLTVRSQDPKELVRKSHEVVQIDAFEAVSTLTLSDGRGNERIRKSTMASMTLADGSEKRIIKFLEPAEVKGTGILIFDYPLKDDDMWIYLPALGKTRRIVSQEKSKSFMGSEFSNADMTAPGLEDFTYVLLGTEQIRGHACFKVEAVPLGDDLKKQYGYSRVVRWIETDTHLVRRSEYDDLRGTHFKTIENTEFELLDPGRKKYMVSHMTAENLLTHRSSVLHMDRAQRGTARADRFTIETLER